jgi:K+-sensing histidine kinase KdpD
VQGAAAAEPVHVDLAELVRTVARDFGVTDRPVEVEVHEGLSTMGDPDATRQAGPRAGPPIVRGLAAACGGHVWAEDAPGGGAVFRVALPRETASLEAV